MIYLLIYISIGYISGLWIVYSFVKNYEEKNKVKYYNSPFKSILTILLCTIFGIFTLHLYLFLTKNKEPFKLRLWYTY